MKTFIADEATLDSLVKKIEEIGEECGLGAAHYFSSRFREVEGVPPSKYREQW